MTNREILKKLKSINEINPDERWVSKSRSDLLLQIKEDSLVVKHNILNKVLAWLKVNFGFFLDIMLPHRFVDTFGRPVIISFVGAMILVGGMSTIGMSQGTVPGDILYPVKIAGESVQLSLTSTAEGKVRIEMEFAGRRIEELNKLAATNKLSALQFEEKINKVTNKLKKNVNTVNIHLAKLDESGEAKKVLEVAEEIDKKVVEYTVVLNKINEIAPAKSKVAEALTQVEMVSDRALEVIVTKYKDVENGISDLEIANKLNDRIAMATSEADMSQDVEIQKEEADQAFADARDLIQTGDFAAALSKITEGKGIIKEIRVKMEEEREQGGSEDVVDGEEEEDGVEDEEIEKLRNEEIDDAQTQDGEEGDVEVLGADNEDGDVEDEVEEKIEDIEEEL
jgi:hypothetical protein